MDSEVIGGSEQPRELMELEAEFAELTDELGVNLEEETSVAADSDEFAELNAAIAGTEFAVGGQESSTPLSILDIADGDFGAGAQEGFLGDLFDKIKRPVVNLVKRRASRLISRLNRLVRQASKYSSCVPMVVAAVAAFKAGKYGTAVKRAYAAFKCIRSK